MLMKQQHANITYQAKVRRLGSTDINDQVQNALANVTLEGLQPSQRAIGLARSVALGRMSADDAVQAVLCEYGSHA